MNLARLLTRPLVVYTPTTGTSRNEYGRLEPGAATSVTVNGYIEPANTSEVDVGQQTAPARWWAALPAGTAVAPTSRITVPDSGQSFEVDGAVEQKWNPRRRRIEFVRVELAEVTA